MGSINKTTVDHNNSKNTSSLELAPAEIAEITKKAYPIICYLNSTVQANRWDKLAYIGDAGSVLDCFSRVDFLMALQNSKYPYTE